MHGYQQNEGCSTRQVLTNGHGSPLMQYQFFLSGLSGCPKRRVSIGSQASHECRWRKTYANSNPFSCFWLYFTDII